MVSSEQRQEVDNRIEHYCATHCATHTLNNQVVVNPRSAIQLAFVLGARLGMAHPTLAGEYMHRWLHDKRIESTPEEMGANHERAMHGIAYPLMYTPEEWDKLTEADDDE